MLKVKSKTITYLEKSWTRRLVFFSSLLYFKCMLISLRYKVDWLITVNYNLVTPTRFMRTVQWESKSLKVGSSSKWLDDCMGTVGIHVELKLLAQLQVLVLDEASRSIACYHRKHSLLWKAFLKLSSLWFLQRWHSTWLSLLHLKNV